MMNLNGVKLHYLKIGQGPPILLLHGGRTWLYTFRNNIAPLAEHNTVYALDFPGHG